MEILDKMTSSKKLLKQALEAVVIDEVHSQSQRFEREITFDDALGNSFKTLGADSIVIDVKEFERFV